MGYVVAAYVIVIGTLAGYAWKLAHERRSLRRSLTGPPGTGAPGANPVDKAGASEV